ncbi:MAG TPA: ATP-binding protein [Candidatus Polarisedimenticolia bacterium]|nr:ATP-binding protein [Candidatus Polarisedimenticolia bacterium]
MSPGSPASRARATRFSPPGDPFYRHLFSSLRCGSITIDREGRITSINDLARRILEIVEPDLLGAPCTTALKNHPKLASIFLEAFRMKNQPNRAEMEIRLKDERKQTIGFSMPLIRDDAGKVLGAALLFRDLTQIEHHQEQEQLKERLAALGQMAAGMAHEIRNPLGGIEVTASLLRRRLASRPEEMALLDRIIGEVKRLNRTVVDSLEYVRPLHLELRPSSLSEVVTEALNSAMAFQEGKTISLSLDLDSSLPSLWIDPDRIRDAVGNLIRNSFEAIPMAGSVRVETRREALPASLRTDLGNAADPAAPGAFDAYAVIRITDTGKGIPEEVHDRLFYPFFTTKQTGSGVGLPLARKIVEGHHGILDFESTVGRGSQFIVKLPLLTRGKEASSLPPTSETREA